MGGAAIGSFLLVVVKRSEVGRDWVKEPSCCETCGRRLTFFDLIPFFSYAALGGRCHTCKTAIGAEHFLCEAWLGMAFAVSFRLFWQNFAVMAGAMAVHAVLTALCAKALLREKQIELFSFMYLAAVMAMLTFAL